MLTYCNHFMTYIRKHDAVQPNLNSAVCQLYFNKTGKKKVKQNRTVNFLSGSQCGSGVTSTVWSQQPA